MWILFGAALAATWPDITPPPATGGGGADAAVVVGIDNYLLVDDVPGARTNAEDWYRWLTTTRGISPARVHLLRDVEGTKEKIERYAAEAVEAAGEGGTVWFVFVGHGAPTPDGQDGVLVGADAQSDPDSLYARSVSRSGLLETLEGGTHARTVVVLDTCFSGQSGRGSLMTGLQPAIPSYAFQAAAKTTVLTAGSAKQFAGPLPDAGRPAFSYLVLGALTGWGDADGNGSVSAQEAVAYASDAISATVKGRKQTPELAGEDVVLSTGGGESGPDIAQMVLDSGPIAQISTEDAEEDARLAALVEVEHARVLAENREKDRIAALQESIRAELDAAAATLQSEATRAWAALEGGEDRDAVIDFVRTYGAAMVRAGDEERGVPIPEVDAARSWLSGSDAPQRIPAPEPWPDIDRELTGLTLWHPLGADWRRSLDDDPSAIWLPWQMVQPLPRALDWYTCNNCDERPIRMAEAERYAIEAATLAEVWGATEDPDQKRQIGRALTGLVLEARDFYRHHSGLLWRGALPPAFEAKPDNFTYSMDDAPFGQLLYWAILEVMDRADDSPACEKLMPGLEKLSLKAAAFGPVEERFEPRDVMAVHRSAARWAKRVGACEDIDEHSSRLHDMFTED